VGFGFLTVRGNPAQSGCIDATVQRQGRCRFSTLFPNYSFLFDLDLASGSVQYLFARPYQETVTDLATVQLPGGATQSLPAVVATALPRDAQPLEEAVGLGGRMAENPSLPALELSQAWWSTMDLERIGLGNQSDPAGGTPSIVTGSAKELPLGWRPSQDLDPWFAGNAWIAETDEWAGSSK
jgi:hypothetical protein